MSPPPRNVKKIAGLVVSSCCASALASLTDEEWQQVWASRSEVFHITPAVAALRGGCVKTSDCNGRRELVSPAAPELGANLNFLQ